MSLHLLPALLLFAAAGGKPPAVPEPPRVTGKKPKEEPRRAVLPGLKKGLKLTVSADSASRKQLGTGKDGAEMSLVTFTGNVEAKRGNLTLTCRNMKVTFARPKPAAGKKPKTQPLRATATGSVSIRTPRRKALAERAEYEILSETLTLSGKRRPVIYQDGDAVAAESFVFHRAKGVFEARGRTVAVILPRKKPGAKRDEKLVPPERESKAGPSMAKRTRIDAAGGAVYDEATRRLYLRKDVLVRQKGFKLSCDRLWVLFTEREKKKEREKSDDETLSKSFGPGSVSKIIAAGKVKISGEGRTGEAEVASYDPAGRIVRLGGRKTAPVIRDGDNHLTAPLIVYHLASGKIESPNGPFKIVVREEKPGAKKPPAPK